MSTVMEIDRRIVGGLLPLLRAGDRLRVLLQRLPAAEQEQVLKLNGIPVRPNVAHRKQVIRNHLAKLAPRLQQDGPARSVLGTWAAPLLARTMWGDDAHLPGDWTAAVLLRLLDADQLSAWLRSACDGVIAGNRGGFDEAELAAAEQWICWLRADAHLEALATALEAATTSIASDWQAPAHDDAFERWQALEGLFGRLADQLTATKAKLATPAGRLLKDLAHLLPDLKAESPDALTAVLDQRADIEAGLTAVRASLETSPARLKPRLSAMLEALEGHVPERDLSILRAGMDAAFGSDDADAPTIDSLADLQPVAPVLHAVARVLLDGCPREDYEDLLLDHLTGRSCQYLERRASTEGGRHTAEGDGPEADEAAGSVDASEAGGEAVDVSAATPAGDGPGDPAGEASASLDGPPIAVVAPGSTPLSGPADAPDLDDVSPVTSGPRDAAGDPSCAIDDAPTNSDVGTHDGAVDGVAAASASTADDGSPRTEGLPAAEDVSSRADAPDAANHGATGPSAPATEAGAPDHHSAAPSGGAADSAPGAESDAPEHHAAAHGDGAAPTASSPDAAPSDAREIPTPDEAPGAAAPEQAEDLIGRLDTRAAAELLLQSPERPGPTLTALVARLIRERTLGPAYLLAEAAGSALEIPVWLVEVVELGVQFQPGFQRSEQRLYNHFNHTAPEAGQLDAAQSRLLMAALVRPALMAPHTTSPGFLLGRIADDFPELHDVAVPLAEFSYRGTPLAGSLLRGLTSRAEWTARREAIERDAARWLDEAPRRRIKYDAATRVWEYWVKEDGDLRVLLERALALPEAADDRDTVQREVQRWRDDTSFTDFLDAADAQCNRRARQMPIKYGARNALKRYADDALELIEACLELANARPQDGGGAEALGRDLLASLREPAQRLIASSSPIDEIDRAGAARLREVLEEVINTFRNEDLRHRRDDPLTARRSLRLRVPPSAGATTTLDDVLRYIRSPMDDASALQAHLRVGGLDEARQLLEASAWSATQHQTLQDGVDVAERRWRANVNRRLDSLVEGVEDAHLKGALDGKERDLFSGRLVELERAVGDTADLFDPRPLLDACAMIEAELRDRIEVRLAQTRERRAQLAQLFEEHGQAVPARVLAEIERALDDSDVSVASDLLARAQKALRQGTVTADHILPPRTRTPDFDELGGALPSLDQEARDLRRLVQRLSANEDIAALAMSELDTSTRAQFVRLLDDWGALASGRQRQGVDHRRRLYSVLRWLGFQIEADVQFNELGRHGVPNFWLHYRLTATTVSPVPLFGSSADGQQHFVLAWGNVGPDQLAQWLAANVGSKAHSVTVLLFTRLTLTERRRTINSVRGTGCAPVVVDLNLLLWLGRFSPLDRTRALFGAGLAGAAYNPYTPEVAGGVPSEMFFGRDDDIEALWSKEGPCIVYGGRQLGKSAMLQQVIRRFNEPEQEQWVLYRGIKTTSDLWEVIRALLVQHKLLKNKGVLKPESVSAAIRDMLNEHPSRRVLLLLDECDYLLEEDRQRDFDQVSRVRELMTETSRRFKVVFAGLHNVQRFQRIPNQPLAHFGTPICIGPLRPKAAAELVTRPLTALGYRFESQSLVQRILAHTNCHPCLLQLFCSELVRTRLQSQRTNVDSEPPFIIDERAISAVYRQVDLAQRMRERFDWTLDLDLRYRAIGYTFAWLELAGEFAGDAASGLPVGQILETLHQTWAQGFAETNEDELSGLLEEMVGLGVLLASAGQRYRLRSPNVLRLLGGEAEVTDELNRLAKLSYSAPADPQVLRRVQEPTDRGSTSPLTLSQEARIGLRTRGIDVVLGSAATRVERVLEAALEVYHLAHAGDGTRRIDLNAKSTPEDALARVKSEYGSSDKGLRLLLHADGMPTSELVAFTKAMADWMTTLTSQLRFVRAVIPLTAEQTWDLHRDGHLHLLNEANLVTIHRLRLWKQAALTNWFHDVNRPPDRPDMAQRLIDETGGWPCLLEQQQAQHCRKDTISPVVRADLPRLAGIEAGGPVEQVLAILQHFKGDYVDQRTLREFVLEETGMPRPLLDAVRRYLLDMNLVRGSDDAVQLEPVIAETLTAAP